MLRHGECRICQEKRDVCRHQSIYSEDNCMKVKIDAKLKLNYIYELTSVGYEIKYKLPNKFFKEETSYTLASTWWGDDIEEKIIDMYEKGELKQSVIKEKIIEIV